MQQNWKDPLFRLIWLVSASVLLLAGGARAARYTWDIGTVWRGSARLARPDAAGPLQVVNLRNGSRFDILKGDAIVLVFNSSCAVCGDNVPRWVDLIDELEESGKKADVYAIATDSLEQTAITYMDGLKTLIPLVRPVNPDDLKRSFGETAVPLTAVVRGGKVVAVHLGVLGTWRRRALLRALGD